MLRRAITQRTRSTKASGFANNTHLFCNKIKSLHICHRHRTLSSSSVVHSEDTGETYRSKPLPPPSTHVPSGFNSTVTTSEGVESPSSTGITNDHSNTVAREDESTRLDFETMQYPSEDISNGKQSSQGTLDATTGDNKSAGMVTTENDKGDTLRKKTATLCQEQQLPFGSFTPETWHDAIEILGHWTHVSKLAQTPESVEQSFYLLDRLVLEQEIQKCHPLSIKLLNTWLMNRMVNNWNLCVRNFHSYSNEDQALLRFEFTPMELLARIEDYSHRSPHLQPNTKTFNLIMEGAGRCCTPSPTGVPGMISPRVATNFAQSLFDRMSTMKEERQNQQPLNGSNSNRTNTVSGIGPDVETYSALIHLFARNGLASRAEALLDRMYKEFKETGDHSVQPTLEIFTTALSAWSRSGEPHAPERAESILQRMQDLSDCGALSVAPDAVTYTVVLYCWAQNTQTRGKRNGRKGPPKGPAKQIQRARELFSKMKHLGYNHTKAYNVMMNILAKDGNVREAERLLKEMHEQYADGNEEARPSSSTYNTILTAWARTGLPACADRAEEVLKDFEQRYHDGAIKDPPCLVTYNSVLLCLSQARQGDRAKLLLEKMKETKDTFGKDINPDAISYNTVINAYAREKDPRKAEAFLEVMYQDYIKSGQNSSLKPSVETFGTVLTAWLRSNETNAPQRAEAILRTMQDLQKAGILEVEPNTIVYNIVLSTWFHARTNEAPRRAEELLIEMEDLYHRGSSLVQPDAMAYEQVLTAYANKRNARKAEEILERRHMQSMSNAQGGGGNIHAKPEKSSYNKVLGAYSRDSKKNAAERADALFRRWQERFSRGVVEFAPDETSIRLVLDAWYHAARYDQNAGKRAVALVKDIHSESLSMEENVSLNMDVHDKVIEIFLKVHDASSAEQYFRWWCGEHDISDSKPNVSTLNKVLGAWNKSKDHQATERIEALLKYVEENPLLSIHPDHASYKILLNCLEEKPCFSAAVRANEVLKKMEKLSVEDCATSKRPNAQDFTQVLRIWSKCNEKEAYLHADPIFREMKKGAESGKAHLIPTNGAYRALINMYSISGDPNAEDRVRHLRAERAQVSHRKGQ